MILYSLTNYLGKPSLAIPPPCCMPCMISVVSEMIIYLCCIYRAGVKTIEPVLLECNFGPDNTRLLKSYPDFINDIFSCLFLYDIEGRDVTILQLWLPSVVCDSPTSGRQGNWRLPLLGERGREEAILLKDLLCSCVSCSSLLSGCGSLRNAFKLFAFLVLQALKTLGWSELLFWPLCKTFKWQQKVEGYSQQLLLVALFFVPVITFSIYCSLN